MKANGIFLLFFAATCITMACHHAPAADTSAPPEVQTPVMVTKISHENMSEFVELNATSTFQLKSIVKANANGYIRSATLKIGHPVNPGELLFTIKTKEAEAIGNAVNGLDSNFRFSGTNQIKASQNGYITQIDHQQGDYVQDGEQLAIISDLGSFAFIMDMPYELKPYLEGKKLVELKLPDGEKLQGTIASTMPTVDAVAQTQRMVIRVNATHPIPENLVAKVSIPRLVRNNVIAVPKEAVLTDETQSDFWVMKLINDTTAVKVPVKKGIENNGKAEILLPVFSDSDRIVISGNYGLEDTAKVAIIQQKQ
jgi:multidrug efflux pump subunit AcrA (membrane-fusion protein)